MEKEATNSRLKGVRWLKLLSAAIALVASVLEMFLTLETSMEGGVTMIDILNMVTAGASGGAGT